MIQNPFKRYRAARGAGPLAALMAAALVMAGGTASAQAPVRVGIPVFLSGPAAGAVGEPSRNAAQIVVEGINAGSIPAPYNTPGLGGQKIEAKIIDEAGNTAAVVTEFRNLVQRDGMDVVLGYFSSANCLAVAPVADQLETLTVFYGCGASRLFEEAQYRYVFRPTPHTTSDNVAAARYVLDRFPDLKTYSGINQNYSWGQDNWGDFVLAMKALAPEARVERELFPKLFAGEYGAEISALLSANSTIVHSSFWDGDLESFALQAAARGLPRRSTLLLTVGEQMLFRQYRNVPDGTIIGARGPHGLLAQDNALNRWFREAYVERFDSEPNFPAYHMYQTLLGLKAAWDEAAGDANGQRPSAEQVAAVFRGLEYETASGPIKMAISDGHQGIQAVALGTYRLNKAENRPEIVDAREYPAECVNPPNGMKAREWLEQGMPDAQC